MLACEAWKDQVRRFFGWTWVRGDGPGFEDGETDGEGEQVIVD
jgi:hypothetical protein